MLPLESNSSNTEQSRKTETERGAENKNTHMSPQMLQIFATLVNVLGRSK